MAAAYITLQTARTTRPDPDALTTALRTAVSDPTAVLTFDPLGTGAWRGKKANPWTSADIAAAQNALDTVAAYDPAVATSRQKDVLATCALVVRSRDITAWNNMTPVQKKNATQAEADVWVNMRRFIENNF
jgi:hypothetical protein